jgi:16S rRNA (adenine1518-N6/adenine1519-N6)-dimethyltransferase
MLTAAGVRPSRARGQNFLIQPAIADRIVEALELRADDTVVEIGPGLGILSERLARSSVKRIVLVELDAKLVAQLRTRFAADTRIEVVEADFLALDLSGLFGRGPIKVVGNLPFNIAAAILRKLCGDAAMVSCAVLMFQREVGERIRARPGDREYGALSVYSALYWRVAAHFIVGAGNFHPRPKVDAEVVRLVPLAMGQFRAVDESTVLATVRAAFSAPRKMLRNALVKSLGLDAEQVEGALRRAAIDPRARAERLAADDLVRLARELKPALNAAAEVSRRDA